MKLIHGVVTGLLAAAPAAAQDVDVPLEPDNWTSQTLFHRDKACGAAARFETHLGRPSLVVPSGFAWAKGVDFRNGTLEADIATYDSGGFYGLAFHVANPDKYEIVFWRPPGFDPTIQYT